MCYSGAMSELPPVNEADRLAAVRRYDILDTPPDGAFDRITRMAAGLFDVPIAIVSIVDEDRIWFKSHHGLDVAEIPRGPGLCASAIVENRPWVLTDAKYDPRSLANPLVAGEFGLRFYAGVPLHTRDGFNLGTLCVIDHEPRDVKQSEVEQLGELAAIVVDELELRLAARNAVRQREALLQEVNHRVANSLSIVAALARMQAATLTDASARGALEEMQARVAAIAGVHRRLYTSDDVSSVRLDEYLAGLAEELEGAMKATGRDHPIVVTAEPIQISTDRAVTLGVIVTELVTNAYKYAYPEGGAGEIRVGIRREGAAGGMLVVEDDGVGSGESTVTRGTGVGGKIVQAMASNLRSKVAVDGAHSGTRVSLAFPI